MPITLVFPDGVRLARKHEIPGPEAVRSALWDRIEAADIAPGFIIKQTSDTQFVAYAEINVDAPNIWAVFCDLCHALLGPVATFIANEDDETPRPLGTADVRMLISTLERYERQLAHDGSLQFGLLDEQGGMITEVLVTPTKHFQVWLNDEKRFRSIMEQHGLRETDHLQFLDEYPHIIVQFTEAIYDGAGKLLKHLADEIDALSSAGGQALH